MLPSLNWMSPCGSEERQKCIGHFKKSLNYLSLCVYVYVCVWCLYHSVLERPEALKSLLVSVQWTGGEFTGLVRKGIVLFHSVLECVTNLGRTFKLCVLNFPSH